MDGKQKFLWGLSKDGALKTFEQIQEECGLPDAIKCIQIIHSLTKSLKEQISSVK